MNYLLSRPLDTTWKHLQNLMLPSRAEISYFPLSEVMSLFHSSALLAERTVIMEDTRFILWILSCTLHSSQSMYLFRAIYKPRKAFMSHVQQWNSHMSRLSWFAGLSWSLCLVRHVWFASFTWDLSTHQAWRPTGWPAKPAYIGLARLRLVYNIVIVCLSQHDM